MARLLGEAGVPASAVFDTKDLYTDPHLIERGFVHHIEHEELGMIPLLQDAFSSAARGGA